MSGLDFWRLIPHRPPFLFVDEVVELSADRVVTVKQTDPAEPYFAGHFPGNPVMPGVLLCEAVFQAGALLMSRRAGGDGADPATPILTRIQDARFRRTVRPGEKLVVEVTLDEELDDACYMTGRVTAGGRNVLRVTFACMRQTESQAARPAAGG